MKVVALVPLSFIASVVIGHPLPTDDQRIQACHVLCGQPSAELPAPTPLHPQCKEADSDPDGDGYGWENGATCIVTKSTPAPTPNPQPQPVPKNPESVSGWAATRSCGESGTVGGGDAATVTVTSLSQLVREMERAGPRVVLVSGKLDTGSDVQRISDVADKTLIGADGAVITGGLRVRRARNLIVRNIEFAGKPAIGFDAFELTESSCVWLDHNNFRDGRDGNLDIVRGSNYVTVSWSRFYYTDGFDHMFSNLQGGANDNPQDVGKLNVTYHHNWFGAGVNSRMPRVRYGQTHIYNNYYRYEKVSGDRGQSYAIGAGQYSNLLVENNFFDGTRNPIVWISEEGTAKVVQRGNVFRDTSGPNVSRGAVFTPPYPYVLDDAQTVPAIVRAGAGTN